MINYAMILGRVGKKDSKQLRNGGEFTTLSIATSKSWKDPTGVKQELTTWHNVNCFSKLSELANKYVHVGDLVFVQGEIQHKKIESGERAGQYAYSVHANELKFLPSMKKTESQARPVQQKIQSHVPIEDDEIPFF